MDKWLIKLDKTKDVSNKVLEGDNSISKTKTPITASVPSTSTKNITFQSSLCEPSTSTSVSNPVSLVSVSDETTNNAQVSDEIVEQIDHIVQYTEELGEEECEQTEGEPKQKKMKLPRKLRNYKFVEQWLEHPTFKKWLSRHSSGVAYCKTCDAKIFPHKNDLNRHMKSAKHMLKFHQVASTKNIESMFNTPASEAIKNAEIKLCAFLAERNLPFSIMDSLPNLCGNIFPDSKISQGLCLKKNKATSIIKNILGKNISEELYSQFRNPGCFFSLIMDETTDVGTKKQCAFTIIFFSKKLNKVVTSFFDLIETAQGDAVSLYNVLKESLSIKKIPISNLVGFSSDTTNVMVGSFNSVFSLLKTDLPDIVNVKCSCHMIHLSASKACLQLPRLVEDMLRSIGAHFSRSYLRQEKFKEFQEFFHIKIHKILLPSQTRWLSLEQCVNRVLEQYEALVAYFTEVTFEDPSHHYQEILSALKNHFTYIYLEFMSYTLGILNNFNTLFQSEIPLLYMLKPEITKMLKTFYQNYLKKGTFEHHDVFTFDHKNPRNFEKLENIYLGVAAQQSIQDKKLLPDNPDIQPHLNNFFISCLNFYVELVTDIKNRFIFEDPIYNIISIVIPAEAQKFEIKSLLPITKRFNFLNNFIDPQALDNEWREHSLLNYDDLELHVSLSPESYWAKVFSLKNAGDMFLFSNLAVVINLLLILPFSNASVERIFSKLSNIKTENRNRLATDTIAALLFTKEKIECDGGCVKFTPTKKMLTSSIWKS